MKTRCDRFTYLAVYAVSVMEYRVWGGVLMLWGLLSPTTKVPTVGQTA